MSAVPVVTPDTRRARPSTNGRRLRLVPRPRKRMARMPFLLVLIALVGVGMVGLLLLNTSLQNQAFEATELRRQAAEMRYAEGELEQLVTEAGSSGELIRKASEMGLRPNRGVAFVQLPHGTVTGDAKADDGLFLPSAISKDDEQLAQERAERAAKRATERRLQEQKVLAGNRQRILDDRAKRQAEAQAAQAQAQPGAAAGQPGGAAQRADAAQPTTAPGAR